MSMLTAALATLQEGAAEEAHPPEAAGEFDLGEMLIDHVSDHPYLEIGSYHLNLPVWEPVRLGGMTIDFSPSAMVVFMVLAGLLSLAIFLAVGARARRTAPSEAPTGLANAAEALVVFFRDEVVRANIGKHADGFTPFILTLFVFILFMNLIGLIPFGLPPSASLSVTAALAFLAFLAIEVSGFRKLGPAGYAKTIFFAPEGLPPIGKFLMLLIMTPIEAMGKLAKPFALAIRLFANMLAGKVLILALLGLIFVFADLVLGKWGIAGGAVSLAAAITLLKVFIALLQAFIFSMLTAVFIGMMQHAH
jgi:F-type H+-transporting ATPase subunit a